MKATDAAVMPQALGAGSSDDAALVSRVVNGDTEAFGGLVRKYRRRYERYAYHMLGNREDAEDALQDAFVRAYDGLRGLHQPERFGAWLLSILANRCRTSRWRRSVHDARFVPEVVEAGVTPDAAGAMEWREEIAAALGELPLEQREAFLLHHVEELDYDEMAQVTGAGISALKMRVKRARDFLGRQLAEAR
ncbi:MAG TPA: RNA polymerase sigma factor [Gemmatimonadales bacterium]|nr:RNA polymerase sigma factor [Gemmatimonadales bacterium]